MCCQNMLHVQCITWFSTLTNTFHVQIWTSKWVEVYAQFAKGHIHTLHVL